MKPCRILQVTQHKVLVFSRALFVHWQSIIYRDIKWSSLSTSMTAFFMILQGKQLGYQLRRWWTQIQWPLESYPDGETLRNGERKIHDDGITWFELMMNFVVTTGRFFPVRQSDADGPTRNAGSAVFLEYMSLEAKMLPHSLRSAARQTVACQSAVQGLIGLGSDDWYPKHVKNCNISLRHLGFKQHLKGLAPRPVLPYQRETAEQIRRYLTALHGGSALSLTLDDLSCAATSTDFDVEEPTPRDRYCRYLRIKNYGLT